MVYYPWYWPFQVVFNSAIKSCQIIVISVRISSSQSTVILRWESLLSPRFFRYGGMISWVVGNSKSKNSPVFKAFIIESVTGINDQISWNAFLVLVGDFQHETGDEGLFLSPPAVIFGFALATLGGCPISTRMRIIITDVLNFLPWHTTMGFCWWSKVLPMAKGLSRGFGGNVEAPRYKYPRRGSIRRFCF